VSEQVTDPAAPGAAEPDPSLHAAGEAETPESVDAGASSPVERITTFVKGRPEVEKVNALIKQRPEVGLGIAFAGGLILATILKRLAR